MLQQIIIHTPLWVWALLAFLMYRGAVASRDREAPLLKVLLIPMVMLALSANGLYQQAQADFSVLEFALLAAAVCGCLSWSLAGRGGIVAYPARGSVFLRGSWLPLLMMSFIFIVKYAAGVMQAMHVHWLQAFWFAPVLGLVYGGFIGAALGKMLRILHLYRRAQSPAASSGLQSEQRSASI